MKNEEILKKNAVLIGKKLQTAPRLCFMCFSPIPSKIAFGKDNAFRTLACEKCYKEQVNEENL